MLEQTVRASVKALTDILALAHPQAFGRATRVKQHVNDLALHIGLGQRWEMEVAALLSQLGCVTLPPTVLEKFCNGHDLGPAERSLADGMTKSAADLIAEIPRLEGVRDILRQQQAPFDGMADAAAIERMRRRPNTYDPAVLDDFAHLQSVRGRCTYGEMPLRNVKPGMVFAEDVRTTEGTLLVARGQDVTLALFERIHNYWIDLPIVEPVRIQIQDSDADVATGAGVGDGATA